MESESGTILGVRRRKRLYAKSAKSYPRRDLHSYVPKPAEGRQQTKKEYVTIENHFHLSFAAAVVSALIFGAMVA